MRKLLQVNILSNFLSTGTIVEDISIAAQKRGWETYVGYGRQAKPGVNYEIKIGSRLSIIEHYIENRLFDNEGLASRSDTMNFISEIKKIRPDIIHLHNIHDHYLNYKILFEFLNETNIPVIWTFHDFWAVTGHCHHFIDANCEKWKTGCYKCPLQHSTVNSMIDRSYRNYELKKSLFTNCNNLTITAVSPWVGEMVKQSFLKNKRIEIINNGIDIDLFKKKDSFIFDYIPKDKFVILAIARKWSFGDRKGLDDYIALSKLLNKDELIVLVGMEESISKQMPPNIIGRNRILDRELLIGLYSRANVLLSLSSAETFGLTVIEAFACGTPAVVYNNTAPPTLIASGTGYIAKNKDIGDVYDKIQIIKKNGKSHYEKACMEHVRTNYSKYKNYDLYVDLYEKLASLSHE